MTSPDLNQIIKLTPRDLGVDEKSQFMDIGKQLAKMLYTGKSGKHELAGMTIEIYIPICSSKETLELKNLISHIGCHASKHEIEIVLNDL